MSHEPRELQLAEQLAPGRHELLVGEDTRGVQPRQLAELLEAVFPEVERKVIRWFEGHFSDDELATLAETLERV